MKKIASITLILLSLMTIGATCSDENEVKECMNACIKQFSICTGTCAGTYAEGSLTYASCVTECGDKRNSCQQECKF